MVDNLLSVIIPSRNGQPYLQKTIDDVLAKAEEEVEVIVVLDGYWPDPQLKDDKRVAIVHHGIWTDNLGLREGVNTGMAIAKGEYVMKIDEHIMMDQGFDKKLKADMEDNWIVIPRRYRLDADEWKLAEDKRPPIDYAYIAYPYERPRDTTCGLHGAEWKQRHFDRKDILIDETMSFQGSCYFMKKAYWDSTIAPLNSDTYGTFTQEPQEVGNKAWFSGGKVMVNKKTWYAHMHKGKRGKGYGFNTAQYEKHGRHNERGRVFCVDFWVNNRWDKRVNDWDWFLEKFWPVPTWPEDWKKVIPFDKNKERQVKNRLDFAVYLNELGFKVGVEVGVHKGYYSKVLCEAIPDLKLTCVDYWTGKTEPLYDKAVELLAPYNTKLVKGTSMDIVKTIPDGSLDFVYIDANHSYDYVKEDIEEWTKKVKIGGIVSGDDYYVFPSGNDGVVKALDEYTDKHRIRRHITPWDKTLGHRDDWNPNWFFFKLNDYR